MLATPISSRAQDGAVVARPWRVEPVVGIWRQERDINTSRLVGPFIGLHVSRQHSGALRWTASAGYYRLEDSNEITLTDATGGSRTDVYDRDIISVTAGVSVDAWQGAATAVTIGFEVGPGWSRARVARSSGSISGPFSEPPAPGWGPAELVGFAAPSLAVRRAVGSRMELTAMGRVLIGVGDIQPRGIPTLGAGLAYRF